MYHHFMLICLFFLRSVGEVAAGRASRSLAQHIPGPGGIEGMKGAASGVVGDLARARIALDERGQKLGELEERTAAMMASADSFSKHAHEVSKSVKKDVELENSYPQLTERRCEIMNAHCTLVLLTNNKQ